jgi:hypothetical protein
MSIFRYFVSLLLVCVAMTAHAMDPREIMQRAYEAQGGDEWANARTLRLEGEGWFYPKGLAEPKTIAERYTMWRVFDPNRQEAHGPDGKVRVEAYTGGKLMFQVGFDGTTTWTEKGPVPEEQAKTFWASNFGFGIIRHVLKPGFVLERLPDDKVDGFPVYMVRITDPTKQVTLFGIDQKSFVIRKAGFNTPRGWHERLYSDFYKLKNPRWLQSGHVRLYYNGVKSNEIFWRKAVVNEPLPDSLFTLPK